MFKPRSVKEQDKRCFLTHERDETKRGGRPTLTLFVSFTFSYIRTMLQDLQEKLDVLKRDTLTPRAIALTRKSLLNRGDGYGLACLIYQVLQQSVDCFLRACRHLNPGSLSTNPSFLLLHDCIQIHLKCSRMDPSLGEELGAQGTHMQLRRVIQFDLSDVQGRMSEEDVDTIIALQDLACEVAVHGNFPMKVSPFSRDTLIERLPLTFEIKPMRTLQNVCDEGGDREIVLIHQVSMRQSAQEDVGFGTSQSSLARAS